MPHSTENQSVLPNGELNSSEFLSHLHSHPIVHDSVSAFKQNKLGALTITYADKSYSIFVSPFIPYASKPYAYVSPYVEHADKLAAQGLDKVDATFPIITKETNTIIDTAFDVAFFPLKKAVQSKDYVLGTFNQEYKACGGPGVVAGGKAVITTSLSVTSDTLTVLSKWLSQAKGQGEITVKEVKDKVSK